MRSTSGFSLFGLGSAPRNPLAAALTRAADRVGCIAGAVMASQAPEFFQQYLQRLEGRLDEAEMELGHFQRAAAASGLTVDGLAASASASADPALVRLGAVVRDASGRVAHLEAGVRSLRDASAFSRPFAFLAHFDAGTAGGTWRAFRPAVPTTAEGCIYAVAGLVLGLVLVRLVVLGAVRGWSCVRHRGSSAAPDSSLPPPSSPPSPRG